MAKDKLLGQEEKQLNALIAEADKRMALLRQELDALPPDDGPELDLRPPGMPANPTFGANSKRMIELNAAIEKEKSDVVVSADKLLAKLPVEVKTESRKELAKWLHPEGNKDDAGMPKSLDKAGEFALNLRYNQKLNADLNKQKTLDQSQDFASTLRSQEPAKNLKGDSKTLNQSQEFMLKLRSGSAVRSGQVKDAKQHGNEPVADASQKADGSKMSMSFFQDLKLNSLDERHQESLKEARMEKDQEPDKDR